MDEEDEVNEVESGPPRRKRGRPTVDERVQRRDDIIDAAVRLFVRDGFEQVTLDDIAAAAHVTKRTIYGYIGDRTDIFLAAVERLREQTLHPNHQVDGSLAHVAEGVVLTLHSDEAVGLHRLMIAEARRFPELARRFYEEGPQSYIAALQRLMPDHDRARAEALFELLLGESHRRRLLGLRDAPDAAAARAQAKAALAAVGLARGKGDEQG